MSFEDNSSFPPGPAEQPVGPISLGEAAQTRALIPDDLRVPWDWTDLLLFVVIYVAGLVVLSALVVTVFALLGVSPLQIQKSASEKNLIGVISQTLLDVALIGYLVAQIRLRSNSPFWRTMGWRSLETGETPRVLAYFGLIFSGLFLGYVVDLASAAFPLKGKVPMQTFFQDRQTALLLVLVGVLVAPLIEEMIFRGYLYPVVARSFGVSAGIIATGVLFGLMHAMQLWGGWWQIGLLIIVGIIFTFARAATRTVIASYLLHLSYNSFQLIGFLVASHGLRNLPAIQ
jgi:hypothetical protein